jgi:hypothetical protein
VQICYRSIISFCMSNVHQRESKKKELVRVVSERTLATKRAPIT